MKNNFLKKLNNIKQDINLEKEQANTIREKLMYFVEQNPIIVRKSWFERLINERSKPLFQTKNILKPMPLIAIITILTTMFGGGVAFASQTSLPGETLYPVKIFTENIKGDLTFSAKGSAEWDTERAMRRLEEASVLTATGKINATSSAEIANRFEEQVNNAKKNVQKLKNEGDVGVAANINSQLESSLKVHHEILTRLEEKNPNFEKIIGLIHTKVKNELEDSQKEGDDLEGIVVNATSSIGMKMAAQGKINAAENVINETQKFISNKSTRLSTQSSADAESKLSEASSTLLEAKAKFDAEMYNEAFDLAKSSMEKAQETKAIVQTQSFFNFHTKTEVEKEENEHNSTSTATSSEEMESNSTSTASSSEQMDHKDDQKEENEKENSNRENKGNINAEIKTQANIENEGTSNEVEGKGELKFRFEF